MSFAPIERTVQKTYSWLKDIEEELGTDNRHRAYHALRSVLHHLRDRLTVEESADFAAELPTLIRGIYYEGWQPSKVPMKIRSKEEFLELIKQDFVKEGEEVNPEEIVKAVFNVIKRRIADGEIKDILSELPKHIREIFEQEIC
ncbi:DUF2267 domain-containing protein [Hydrogenothermus marinus]|uniref:Uncharacterized protein (DUF2267 family) n=1 Tax=Hydrogenothermus marinus TaxID=133270 RepID=A0A3M0BC69_9AQUI|nr:DUF2267 domain-containing protein [Hydrogenothermus marinus]RMA92508.1 uncharacterized protein (DUF2267 family) [Hydrogenothermus marinus]